MFVRRLSLTNFRNYRQQELSLPQGPILLLGGNAQGKSNLLEAIFLLAATRSPRTLSESELIHWDAQREPQPVARLLAEAERRAGPIQLEMVVAGRPLASPPGEGARLATSKRLRVNGVPRRQADVVGLLNAVLFTSQDMELIGGPPALRRRYLDITLSQIDRGYLPALQAYARVLSQRNALLRRIQDGGAAPEELAFWDEEMARHGGIIVGARARAVEALAGHVPEEHRRLSLGRETLGLTYVPRLPAGWDGRQAAAASEADLAATLRAGLESGRRRDVAAGVSLLGPHRDDLALALDGLSAAAFASRGQQRTAALALRLAEARFLRERSGDEPLLLLDDVLSELDEGRRASVIEAVGSCEQILVTSADADRFGEAFLRSATVLRVTAGRIEPAP